MKVQNIKNIDAFFKVINDCEERVELVTGEGDRLNLKSNLSKYVALANVFSDGIIPEMELATYSPADAERLLRFMLTEGE